MFTPGYRLECGNLINIIQNVLTYIKVNTKKYEKNMKRWLTSLYWIPKKLSAVLDGTNKGPMPSGQSQAVDYDDDGDILIKLN